MWKHLGLDPHSPGLLVAGDNCSLKIEDKTRFVLGVENSSTCFLGAVGTQDWVRLSAPEPHGCACCGVRGPRTR